MDRQSAGQRPVLSDAGSTRQGKMYGKRKIDEHWQRLMSHPRLMISCFIAAVMLPLNKMLINKVGILPAIYRTRSGMFILLLIVIGRKTMSTLRCRRHQQYYTSIALYFKLNIYVKIRKLIKKQKELEKCRTSCMNGQIIFHC